VAVSLSFKNERKVNSLSTFLSQKERKGKSKNFFFAFRGVEDRARFSMLFYQEES
jgi:hypothetical protein